MIRVLLVDDQAVVRAGFRVLLEAEGGFDVVGEASTGPAAVALARRLAPDVVCMDVRMPGGDGITATRKITEMEGAPAVLVVTTFELDEYVFGALEAGASGFLLKDAEPAELAEAIRRLAHGDGLIDERVIKKVIDEFARRQPSACAREVATLLTAREAEIVRVLAEGCSNAEIAALLFIESSTVKSHLTRAMAKIGTRDRLQTVVWAHRHGLAPSRCPGQTQSVSRTRTGGRPLRFPGSGQPLRDRVADRREPCVLERPTEERAPDAAERLRIR